MKKVIIIIVYILFGVSMTACNTSMSEESTTTEQQTNSSITEVLTTVENDRASFFVQIDSNTINDSNPVVTVVVEITAKEVIDQILETSSYGDEGLIRIRVISIDDEDKLLYSEFYDIPFVDEEHDVHLDINDNLTRTIQFARMPFHGGAGGELPSPTGVYKVQVSLFSPEMIWIDTELFITVE